MCGKGAQCDSQPDLSRLDGYTVSVYREPMIHSFADATTADLWKSETARPRAEFRGSCGRLCIGS
jgi:hypothetical protein